MKFELTQTETNTDTATLENREFSTIEDILALAEEKEFVLPGKHIEYMKKGIEENIVSAKYLAGFVSQVSKKQQKEGRAWYAHTNPENGKVLMIYGSLYSVPQAYIARRTNKETGEQFYSAIRLQEKDGRTEHKNLSTNNDLDKLKERVSLYFNQVLINEVSADNRMAKKQRLGQEPEAEKEVPAVISPEDGLDF